MEELRYLARMTAKYEDLTKPRTVLIGGWSVHSYNPWYGSIDIDLITDSNGKKRIVDRLVHERGFNHFRGPDDRRGISKTVVQNRKIIIDFGVRDRPDPFEGRSESMDYRILDGRTVLRDIDNGTPFPVPDRTLLLVLKLKAAWDRRYRLEHGSSHDLEWEKGKLLKDGGDILALLDPKHGGHDVRLDLLGSSLDRWPFLLTPLENVLNDTETIAIYGRMSVEMVADIRESLISSIERN